MADAPAAQAPPPRRVHCWLSVLRPPRRQPSWGEVVRSFSSPTTCAGPGADTPTERQAAAAAVRVLRVSALQAAKGGRGCGCVGACRLTRLVGAREERQAEATARSGSPVFN